MEQWKVFLEPRNELIYVYTKLYPSQEDSCIIDSKIQPFPYLHHPWGYSYKGKPYRKWSEHFLEYLVLRNHPMQGFCLNQDPFLIMKDYMFTEKTIQKTFFFSVLKQPLIGLIRLQSLYRSDLCRAYYDMKIQEPQYTASVCTCMHIEQASVHTIFKNTRLRYDFNIISLLIDILLVLRKEMAR